MKFFNSLVLLAVLAGCGEKPVTSPASNIVGTWQLVSGTTIEKGNVTHIDYTKGQRMIKIISPTHFAFMLHDLNHGKDTTASFSSGGGRYDLTGDKYTEHLEYCNSREWEGKDFEFEISVRGDTLVQKGVEKVEAAGIDREITEKYIRVK